MSGFDVNIPRDPIGVKGTDGATKTSPANPLDVQIQGGGGSGLATEVTLAAVLAAVDELEFKADAVNVNLGDVETLLAATNAALAALEAANDTSGDDIVTALTALQSALQGDLADIEADIEAFKAAFDARDLATETTLAASKEVLDNILLAVDGLEGNTDDLETKLEEIKTKLDALNATDFATETTQATLLTEADFDARVGNVSATPTANTVLGRLKDIHDSLAAIDLDTEDLATETTLSSVLAAVDGVEALLTSLDGKDYATETTLAAFKAEAKSESDATQAILATLLTEATFAAEDFATQTTLEAARALIASLDTKFDVLLSTRASEATVATLLTEATFLAEDFATSANQDTANELLAAIDLTSAHYLDQIFRATGMACTRETQTITLEALANDFGFGPSQPGVIGVANPVVPSSPTLTFTLVGELQTTEGQVDLYEVDGPDATHTIYFSNCQLASTHAAQVDGTQRTGVLGSDGATIMSPGNPLDVAIVAGGSITAQSPTEIWAALKTGNASTLSSTFNMEASGVYRYHAFADRGTATSALDWTVMRIEFVDASQEDAIQFLVNENMAWDDRVAGGTQGWSP